MLFFIIILFKNTLCSFINVLVKYDQNKKWWDSFFIHSIKKIRILTGKFLSTIFYLSGKSIDILQKLVEANNRCYLSQVRFLSSAHYNGSIKLYFLISETWHENSSIKKNFLFNSQSINQSGLLCLIKNDLDN